MPVLRYGTSSSIDLKFANGVQPDQYGTPRGEPLADVSAAVATALDDPLDFPPLRQSTTPGDQVVLALGPGVPQAAEVIATIVRSLVDSGVEPDGISVLRTQADVVAGAEDPCRLIRGIVGERVRLETHDPGKRGGLAYLAATEAGDPIHLNRLLTDADLVLPIGCVHRAKAAGYFGIHTGLFPAFSDQQAQSRFRRTESLHPNGHHRRALEEEVNHVAWLLGITLTVQLIPSAGDRVLHVLAGQGDSVGRRSQELYEAAWGSPVARRASLVVAAIEGDARQQTWENLGLALEAADRLVEEDGAVAICCDLAAQPGPAVQCMLGGRGRETAVRQIRRDGPVDALAAAQLVRSVQRDHVYLLSQLDPSLVEDLEMIPISGPEELVRLAQHHDSCILLANAPQAVVNIESE